MRSLSDTVAMLEARRSTLTKELSAIEVRLEAISNALGRKNSAALLLADAKGGGRRARAAKGAGTRTTKRTWFDKNEVAKLLRRAAKRPTAVADIVRELARMKGYNETLSPDEMHRFQGAAFMAVAQGVKNKVLKRRADGTVVVA